MFNNLKNKKGERKMKKINESYYVMDTLSVHSALNDVNKIISLQNLVIKPHSEINQKRQSVEISLHEKENFFDHIKKNKDINLLKKLINKNQEENKKLSELVSFLKKEYEG
jgi:hypothetical protein|tara:strand:+ start:253 stop:585 length:333 start_codon:yes stop_codon:yes gene_type:complete